MADGIAQWLERNGLGQYADAFVENDVDVEVLPHLTDEDLKELGLSLGHRRKMLRAISGVTPMPPSAAPAESVRTIPSQAERRQITVMFCDLVGSTAMSSGLDPEDMREVILEYQQAVVREIERMGGHVARYMGDGVLAYFGYPQAHEDDPERAVRAGLAMVDAVSRLSTPSGERMAARIGISTGLVVVGDLIGEGGSQERAAVGDTPNLAARLQGLAQPNSVVVSPATRRLLGGLFELEDLGLHDLKGISEPVRPWRILGDSRAESRFAALRGGAVTPLVGRDEEFGLMLSRWERAKAGEGQLVLLSGEAGIGKSRIAEKLIETISAGPHALLRHYCSPFYVDSAFYPITVQVERAANIQTTDTAEEKLDKLENMLGAVSSNVAATAPLMAALLSIPSEDRYPPLNLTPQAQKTRTIDALIGRVAGLAAHEPALVVFEDAHWSDPTTNELLEHLINRLHDMPVLLLITFRPEFEPPWRGYAAALTSVTLSRLGQRGGEEMVERVAGGKKLPAEVVKQILLKTDGVPLFIEELTKTVLETGTLHDAGDHYELKAPLQQVAIPTTLQDSLMSRLDRLSPVKEVAQIGSVIGREFNYPLLAAVAERSDNVLEDSLFALVDSELIFQSGNPPDATYTFKHALVQDAAYQSLLRSKRQQIHARIAAVLENEFSHTVETEPEILARHYTSAGMGENAIPYYMKAGQRALQSSAIAESLSHLHAGLELALALPESPQRDRYEYDLHAALGLTYISQQGWQATQVAEHLEAAYALGQKLDEHESLLPVVYGIWINRFNRAEFEPAQEWLDKAISGEADGGDDWGVISHTMAALHHMWLSHHREVAVHADQVLALYDPDRHRDLVFKFGNNPKVITLAHRSLSLWITGYPDQAENARILAEEHARATGHPFDMAYQLSFGALALFFSRDIERFAALVAEGVAVGDAQSVPFMQFVFGPIHSGICDLMTGEPRSAVEKLSRAIGTWEAIEGRLCLPKWKSLLAQAHAAAGEIEQGLSLVEEAIALASQSGESWYEPEVHRIKGDLLLSLPVPDAAGAEATYENARTLARDLGARSWELRAVLSLAKLWQQQGRIAEAREQLAPVYQWFTEGFDTADLKEANALLEALNRDAALL